MEKQWLKSIWGQHDKAMASAKRGLDIEPDDPRLQDMMGQIMAKRGTGN